MLTVEIGVGLVSGGVFFLVLGLIMFFDATLLAMGNVLFVSGISLLIGPQKTLMFFTRKQKIRGTVCFFTGMALVFLRWALIGMVVEMIGFLNLFGCVLCIDIFRDFFPVILSFLRQVPIVGRVLSLPGVSQVRTIPALTGPGHGSTCRYATLSRVIPSVCIPHKYSTCNTVVLYARHSQCAIHYEPSGPIPQPIKRLVQKFE